MAVTTATWIVALTGIALIGLLMAFQVVALKRPRDSSTIQNVYGGQPETEYPDAFFAFYQAFARADVYVWGPLQIAGSVGMLLGERWGFLLALMASVPFWYTAVVFFVWDRDLALRRPTVGYWVVVFGMWPAFGILETAYCLTRLI